MSKFSISIVAFLFFPLCLFSQKHIERGYETILSSDARIFIETLSHDSLQGRKAGEAGGYKAAEYIVSLLREWKIKPLDASGYLQPFDAGVCKMNNILAVIPGKSNEYVIVGAHYDHLGVDTTLVGDQCYNGADDNASGVSAVLQLARAIKKTKVQPERTIIFAFWDGEEKGFLGSRFFVKRTPFLSEISAYMNFDMVGRAATGNSCNLSYIYSSGNPVFGEWLQADVENYKLELMPDFKASKNLLGGSDNSPFARKGVPIVWYHTEGHSDYHRPSDTADKVNYPKLLEITRAAYLCLWRLANEASY